MPPHHEPVPIARCGHSILGKSSMKENAEVGHRALRWAALVFVSTGTLAAIELATHGSSAIEIGVAFLGLTDSKPTV